MPDDVLARLDAACARPEVWHLGYHACPFCPRIHTQAGELPQGYPAKLHRGSDVLVGDGVVRFTGEDGTVYVAPNMIAHYIHEHGYAPPPAFQAAVRHSADARG